MTSALGTPITGPERESGLPKTEALLSVTRVSLGETGVMGGGFPRVLGTSTAAVTGSGTQAPLVLVVVGGH